MAPPKIYTLRLSFSTAYVLVQERSAVLVDSGVRREEHKILRALEKLSINPEQLTLLIHTHAHADHAGSSAALASLVGIPTALHLRDADMASKGENRKPRFATPTGKLIFPFVNFSYTPFTPSILFESQFSLRPFGVDALVIPTPGHSAGSVSIVTPTGECICGDSVLGGYWGGMIAPHKATTHYYAESMPENINSVRLLLANQVHTFYPGHGGEIPRASVERWLQRVSSRYEI